MASLHDASAVSSRWRGSGLVACGHLLGVLLWTSAGGLRRVGFGTRSDLSWTLPPLVFALGLAVILAAALRQQRAADTDDVLTWVTGTLGVGFLGVFAGWQWGGTSAQAPVSGAPWDLVPLGSVLLGATALMVVLRHRRSRVRGRTQRSGTQTRGLVIRVRDDNNPEDRHGTWVTVRFVDAHGRPQWLTRRVSGPRLHPGQQVPVVYDPDHPDRAEAVLLDL